ncbi:response regulator [Chloroflexota bacterium]
MLAMTDSRSGSATRQGKAGTISVIVADDHPLFRQSIRNVLEKKPDFQVVAEADDGAAAVKLTAELQPDVDGRFRDGDEDGA